MGHAIVGNRFAITEREHRRQPAWHAIGNPYDTIDLAVIDDLVGDIQVSKFQAAWKDDDGVYHGVPNEFYAMRHPYSDDPNFYRIDTVADRWVAPNLADNIKAVLGPLMDQGYRIHTAGVLEHGVNIFVSLQGPTWELDNGEVHHSYLSFSFSATPKRNNMVRETTVMEVCKNTQSMADSRCAYSFSTGNHKHTNLEMGIAAKLIDFAKTKREDNIELFNKLIGMPLTREMETSILDAVFPVPSIDSIKDPIADLFGEGKTQKDVLKQIYAADDGKEFRTMLGVKETDDIVADTEKSVTLFKKLLTKRDKGFDTIAEQELHRANVLEIHETAYEENNLYSMVNAVTEYADWRPGKRTIKDKTTFLTGNRAKEKVVAFETATELLTV